MKHQEYRNIEVGPHDLLKNGQMVMVSVCDPFNDQLYHPTDKIIILKYRDVYYALGAFCGFDYTPLAKGAFIGNKIICPTCASAYDIRNGYVENGPTIRNISSFNIQTRDNRVKVTIPEHVPAFAIRPGEKERIDPRVFVVLGDSEAALSAIDSLRILFAGKIIVIT